MTETDAYVPDDDVTLRYGGAEYGKIPGRETVCTGVLDSGSVSRNLEFIWTRGTAATFCRLSAHHIDAVRSAAATAKMRWRFSCAGDDKRSDGGTDGERA